LRGFFDIVESYQSENVVEILSLGHCNDTHVVLGLLEVTEGLELLFEELGELRYFIGQLQLIEGRRELLDLHGALGGLLVGLAGHPLILQLSLQVVSLFGRERSVAQISTTDNLILVRNVEAELTAAPELGGQDINLIEIDLVESEKMELSQHCLIGFEGHPNWLFQDGLAVHVQHRVLGIGFCQELNCGDFVRPIQQQTL
jgi:hypothetical protein